MKYVIKYLRRYIFQAISAPAFKMCEAFFELLVPILVKKIIDDGIAYGNTSVITKYGIIVVALGVLGFTFTLLAQYFSAKVAAGVASSMCHDLFVHVQYLSFPEFDELGGSTLITRMTNDINQVRQGVNLTLRLLLRSPFIVFGAFVMSFTIDVQAAFVFAIVILILALLVFGVMLYTIPMYKRVQSKVDGVMRKIRENLNGVRVIRAFCKENDERKSFEEKNNNLRKMQNRVARVASLLNPLTYVTVNMGIVALMYVGAIKIENGILTQGAIIALYNYMAQILTELIKFANMIININKSLASSKRINEIMNTEITVRACKSDTCVKESEYAVEFSGVDMMYKNAGEKTLKNISFQIKKGETVGIIGGTGSGKTSLINLIPRFYDTLSGQVSVNGRNVKEYDLKELRDKIGIVQQKATLFKGTIKENILVGGNETTTDDDILDSINASQAMNFVLNKKENTEYMIEQGAGNLSGGQAQRLTIARALVRKPEILILDDSMSALDYATDLALRRALHEYCNNTTVIIVSQRTSSIMNSDMIIVMDDGMIKGMGKHDELLKNCDIYREIYASQHSEAI